MAEESNVHVKVAMADVLGLLAIAFFTFLVAGLGLSINGAAPIAAVAVPVGIVVLIVAFIAFMNENLLGTAIFGPLGIFFLAFVGIHMAGGIDATMALVFIGIVVLIDAIVAFAQPVKLLPILLLVAAAAFFTTALFYNGMAEMQIVFGALWMLYSLISFYMAAAIMMLVIKGKQVLPLLISAPAAAKA